METSLHLTGNLFGEELDGFLEVIPVKTYPSQEKDGVSTTKMVRRRAVVFGSSVYASSENADRLGLLLRTYLLSELAGLTPFSKVWKRRDTPAGRSWWVLTTLAPRIEENESGSLDLWTTPDTCKGGDSTDRMNGITHRTDGSYITLRLETQSKMWRSPVAGTPNRQRGGGQDPAVRMAQGHAIDLKDQVTVWRTPRNSTGRDLTAKHGNVEGQAATWPTPTVQDGENNAGASRFERNSLPLNAIVSNWPTSRSNDAEKRGMIDATNPRNGLPGASQGFHLAQQEIGQVSTPNTGRLNWRFVSRMMGYPDDWFDDNSDQELQFSED